MHDLIIINDRGRRFGVRVVRPGDRYGLDDKLTHVGEHPLIEFYDLTYTDKFGPLGQFVSRYHRSTLIESHHGYGLDLDGGVDAWKIDADAMQQVYRLIALTWEEA